MNSFPSAASGMKKLFKAEIFMLVGAILSALSLIFTFLAVTNFALLIVVTICVIAGLVFSLVGYINSLIAVKRAGADHSGYNSAFLCMIFALIITVVGSDKVGIIAKVSDYLCKHSINIADITQTILSGNFVMMMMVELDKADISIDELRKDFAEKAEELGVEINIMSEKVFGAMHRI